MKAPGSGLYGLPKGGSAALRSHHEILVAQEGEGDFLYRLPKGGVAALAKIAWKGNQAAQRRFLKSCSHPAQLSIKEYGLLHDAGGILVYRQIKKWLDGRKAFVIEWLDNPVERENRALSRENSALSRAVGILRAKAAKGPLSGGAATARKYGGEHEAIRRIVEVVCKENTKANRATLIRLSLEKCENAGHKTYRAKILRYASEFLPRRT